MLEEKDLQAIAQIMDGKLSQLKDEILDEATHRMQVLLDAEVTPKFNLLADEISLIREALVAPETLNKIDWRLDLHETMLQKHAREIAALKLAK